MTRKKYTPQKKIRIQPARGVRNTSSVISPIENHGNTSTTDQSTESPTSPEMSNDLLKKFFLPKLDEADPELWFEVVDTIFTANGIDDEMNRFSHLLERLNTDHFRNIRDIVNSNDDDVKKSAYSLAKAKLILVLGESEERKLDRLLSVSDIPPRTKPSVILQILGDLAGKSQCHDIVKRIWLNKLPKQINVILAGDKETDLEQLAKNADNMFEVLNQTPSPTSQSSVPHSEVFATQNSVPSTNNDAITGLLKMLASEVAALRLDNATLHKKFSEHRSRSRNRTPDSATSGSDSEDYRRQRRHSKSRHRNQSLEKLPPPLYNGLCWYHFHFGDNAKKCANSQCSMKNKILEN